jgi:DNA-binding response OmpR family regulator
MIKRILIAEDDALSREMLEMNATIHGYVFTSVVDGVDLLSAIKSNTYDVIVTDLMMDNLNGASASEILKMHGSKTPIIALTSLSPEETDLVKDSFANIFHKPCDFKQMFGYIDHLVGK